MAAHGPRWARRLLLVAATGLLSRPAAGVNHPFGAHTSAYATGGILPDHVSQAAMDQAVRDLYDAGKGQYLRQTCGTGRYVVATGVAPGNLTVSEGHGYGMILTALMAGPVRGTLALGSTAAAGQAGACGLTASLACTGSGSTLRCR